MDSNLFPLLRPLIRSWRFIFGLTLAAGILSVIIALLLPNFYESETRFYTASPDLGKPEKIFGLTGKDMEYYGSEDDRDRFLSLAESGMMLQFLIDSFQLMEYYEIDDSSQSGGSSAQAALSGDLTILTDERDAIRMKMVHTSDTAARDIVVAARNFAEQQIVQFQKQGQKRVIETFEHSIRDKEKLIQRYTDTLKQLQERYGIIEPETQSELIATSITNAETDLAEALGKLNRLQSSPGARRDSIIKVETRIDGFKAKIARLTSDTLTTTSYSNIKKFTAGLSQFEYYKRLNDGMKSDISNEMRRLEFFRSAYTANPPGIHLVEEAGIPDSKSYPVRWLIVSMSTLGAFLFSLIWVWSLHSYRHFPWDRLLGEDDA